MRDLTAQLNRVLSGAPSAVEEMATQTGSKDKYFGYYVAKLQDAVNAVRERHKHTPPTAGISRSADIRQTLADVRKTMPDVLFNPTLRIPGWSSVYNILCRRVLTIKWTRRV